MSQCGGYIATFLLQIPDGPTSERLNYVLLERNGRLLGRKMLSQVISIYIVQCVIVDFLGSLDSLNPFGGRISLLHPIYSGSYFLEVDAKGVAGLGKAGGDGSAGSDKAGQQVPPEVYIALTYAAIAFLCTLSVPLILYFLNKLLNKIEDCFGCGPSSRGGSGGGVGSGSGRGSGGDLMKSSRKLTSTTIQRHRNLPGKSLRLDGNSNNRNANIMRQNNNLNIHNAQKQAYNDTLNNYAKFSTKTTANGKKHTHTSKNNATKSNEKKTKSTSTIFSDGISASVDSSNSNTTISNSTTTTASPNSDIIMSYNEEARGNNHNKRNHKNKDSMSGKQDKCGFAAERRSHARAALQKQAQIDHTDNQQHQPSHGQSQLASKSSVFPDTQQQQHELRQNGFVATGSQIFQQNSQFHHNLMNINSKPAGDLQPVIGPFGISKQAAASPTFYHNGDINDNNLDNFHPNIDMNNNNNNSIPLSITGQLIKNTKPTFLASPSSDDQVEIIPTTQLDCNNISASNNHNYNQSKFLSTHHNRHASSQSIGSNNQQR